MSKLHPVATLGPPNPELPNWSLSGIGGQQLIRTGRDVKHLPRPLPNSPGLPSRSTDFLVFPSGAALSAESLSRRGTRYWPKMLCNDQGVNCLLGSSGGPGEGCSSLADASALAGRSMLVPGVSGAGSRVSAIDLFALMGTPG